MNKGFQIFFSLAIVCAFSVLIARSNAQAIPILTDPIKVAEIELLAEKLDMTTPQRESMLGNYDRYLADFARVRNSEVQDFEDSLTELAAQFGFMAFNIPERTEVEKLISEARRAMKSIRRVDNLFFDEISGMLTEKQRKVLKHQRIVRELQAYELIALQLAEELNSGVRGHFSKFCDKLHVSATPEVEMILETYESRFLKLAKASFESMIDAVHSALDMIDELEIRGADQQTLMMRFMNEESIEDLKVRGNLLLAPLKKAAFDLSELNWKTWKQLDGVLQEEEALKLQEMFFSKAYREAVRGYEKISRLFERALELDDVSDDQRVGLRELQITFRSRGAIKSAKYAAILGRTRETQTIEQMNREVPGKYDEELEVASKAREDFVESTEAQINNLLGTELVDALYSSKMNAKATKFGSSQPIVVSQSNGSSVAVEVVSTSTKMLMAGIEVPQSISPSFPKRGATILGLEESGIAIIDALYDTYREQYDQVHVKAEEAGQAITNDTSLSTSSRIKQARSATDEASEAVAALDANFFSDLAVVTGVGREDPNLLMLEHHRERQRGAGSMDPYGWGGGAEEAVDLVQLYVVSKNAKELQAQISSGTAAKLRNKMQSYHEYISELFTTLAETQYDLAHMQEAMQAMAETQNNERMMESIQKRWREAFVAIRNAKSALLVANKKFVDDVLGELSKTDRRLVRMQYVKKAYPYIFRNKEDATTMLTAALAIQNLNASQRDQLEQLSSSYNYDYWRLCEKMIENRQLITEKKNSESIFDQKDMRREIELEKLRFERSELGNRAKMRLRMILAKEQIKEVPGLHPSITAVTE